MPVGISTNSSVPPGGGRTRWRVESCISVVPAVVGDAEVSTAVGSAVDDDAVGAASAVPAVVDGAVVSTAVVPADDDAAGLAAAVVPAVVEDAVEIAAMVPEVDDDAVV